MTTRYEQALATFNRAMGRARTTKQQGAALETLIKCLLERVPGINLTERDVLNVFAAEEIDLAVWNEQSGRGLIGFDHIILIECKNWSQATGAEEVAWFDTKLRERGRTQGILIALNGITGNARNLTRAHSIVAGALRDRREIIVLTGADLRGIRVPEDLVTLLRRKRLRLVATQGLVA